MNIPEPLRRTVLSLYGKAGEAWLERLPAHLQTYAERWGLRLGAPFAPLSYHYVVAATRRNGSEAVLKVGFPNPELTSEAAALAHYGGNGCARLLEADAAAGALLIERLRPGTPLSALVRQGEDERATSVAAGVMRGLWRAAPVQHDFPTVEVWGREFRRARERFGGGCGPLPVKLMDQAERRFAELAASMDEPVLLHGDLHHDNILAAGRAPWLAIDPKGLVGEPAYEVGALLRNPLPELLEMPDPRAACARRVDVLAEELGLDRARVRGWGVAQAVLSVLWGIEDGEEGWEPMIAVAELLASH